MKFTFGIATTDTSQRMSGNTNNHVSDIVDSIRANNIPIEIISITYKENVLYEEVLDFYFKNPIALYQYIYHEDYDNRNNYEEYRI